MFKNRRSVLKYISHTVTLVGLLVILGWFIGSDLLIRLHPDLTSMKFIAAFLFFLCGIQMWMLVKIFIDLNDRYYRHLMLLSTVSICIILMCVALIVSPGLGHILNLFPTEKQYDILTTIPFIPSILTLTVLLIISFTRIFLITNYDETLRILPHVGVGIIIFGFLGLIGNIFRINPLFFSTSFSGGVALHSSFLICLIGLFYWLLASELKNKKG